MHVSTQVSEWVEAAITTHARPSEDFWWDVTMAPAGGPDNSPFLAIVVSARSPILEQSLNLAGTFVNFMELDAAGVDAWILDALAAIREAQSQALVQSQPGAGRTPFNRIGGNGAAPPSAPGVAPGKLYLPGAGKQEP